MTILRGHIGLKLKIQSFGINLSNRSGNLNNAEYKIPEVKKALNKVCNYPAYTFFIDYNGDVQMCSHDWAKKYVIGNINNEKSQASIDLVVDELFLKDFAYSSRVSIVTTPKFKIRNTDSLYPIGAFNAMVETNKDTDEIGEHLTGENAYYSTNKVSDYMKQFVSGRCDRSTSFPINFEYVNQ